MIQLRSHIEIPAPVLTLSIALSIAGFVPSGWAAPTEETSIPVPNYSFETPTAPASSGTPLLEVWQQSDQPVWYDPNATGVPWINLAGTFDGGPANRDGNQGAFLVTVPEVGISQTLTETFQVGVSYDLTVALHSSSVPLSPGDQLQMGLFYSGSSTPIASRTITFDIDLGFSTLYEDFSLNLPTVQAGDAWANQPIEIGFVSASGTGSGIWDLDNVRLTAVPEPSTFALLAGGLGYGLLVAYRRKKTRNSTQPDAAVK